MDIRTTIAVSVTVKVDVIGDFNSPDDLTSAAVLKAHDGVEAAINLHESFKALVDGAHHGPRSEALGITVEGATALVNREALESLFTDGR